ncbi:alpha/beta hydrolase [Actinomycetospora sp. OC33-EN08]|uniref:Alpha/beta hydrolase n=1 Tax=Actinomycetospora aurantiaca TaxID=3129233 RepID=A0ABU8MLI2_9PSEU
MRIDELTTGSDTTHLSTCGDDDGEPLLFLHGTGPGATGSQAFRPILPALDGFRCLVPDLVGFGRSSHPEDVAIGPGPWFARRVDAVLALLDVLGLHRVHLVGHSYGARLALELALRVPERVGRVVLMAAGGTPVKPNLTTLTDFYRTPDEAGMRTLVEVQLSRDVPDIEDVVVQRLAVALRPEVRRSFQAATGAGDPMPIYDETVLPGVPHRVLAVHGKDDATITVDASLFLAEHLRRSDLHLFADCGHLLQFEVPTRLGALVHDFLTVP